MGIDTYIEIESRSNKVGTDLECFNPALQLLPFWDLLICFWICAQDLKLPWAIGFENRLSSQSLNSADLDWLTKAMGHTFAALQEPLKSAALPEYQIFLAMSKVCNWWAWYQRAMLAAELGPEWTAWIVGQGYQVTRTVRAFSREAAEKKLIVNRYESVREWK
jgi:hypothetical protein